MLKRIASPFERLVGAYAEHRARQEEERRTEFQYAREMRARSVYGTPQYYYYNAIVVNLGGR
ncbi:MAG: hypothetical protein AAGH60_14555 [Pseudomonadota bacterium]